MTSFNWKMFFAFLIVKSTLKLVDFIGPAKNLYYFLSDWNMEGPRACSPDSEGHSSLFA